MLAWTTVMIICYEHGLYSDVRGMECVNHSGAISYAKFSKTNDCCDQRALPTILPDLKNKTNS